jgi:hypothetical protein
MPNNVAMANELYSMLQDTAADESEVLHQHLAAEKENPRKLCRLLIAVVPVRIELRFYSTSSITAHHSSLGRCDFKRDKFPQCMP